MTVLPVPSKRSTKAFSPPMQFYQKLKLQQQILPRGLFSDEARLTHDGMNIRNSHSWARKIHMKYYTVGLAHANLNLYIKKGILSNDIH
jgi:hypothetical protein